MKKNLIGNYYPFFLDNKSPWNAWYLYQLVTNRLSDDCVPMFTLKKIAERTRKEDYSATENKMWSSDIISEILRSRKEIETKATDYVEGLLGNSEAVVYKADTEFPDIEMTPDNELQKSLIIGLRDALRWKTYHFAKDYYVDIMNSQSTFILFKICGDDNKTLWLEPVGEYDIMDTNLKNPKKVSSDLDILKETWSGDRRASDMNRSIKIMEWHSFGEE